MLWYQQEEAQDLVLAAELDQQQEGGAQIGWAALVFKILKA